MIHPRHFLLLPGLSLLLIEALAPPATGAELHLGQGVLSGEVTDSSVLVQTRLTTAMELDENGDLPGAPGWVQFEWSEREDFTDSSFTEGGEAKAEHDFIVREVLTGLKAGTRYFFRPQYGPKVTALQTGDTATFKTLPGATAETRVNFIVTSCMNYMKFIHGKKGRASGPVTATEEDKRLGFPAFVAMKKLEADFLVGTGDIVYYDNPMRMAETLPELRRCWHEQFRFPRMIDYFREVPTYWSKDDHDFRYNDSDNSSDRLPMSDTGIGLFKEQLPIAPMDDADAPTYRTHRVSRDLQIWMTEGRDYRSDNLMEDGPGKTQWATEQRDWLKRTLKESDAKWKILITPTPMVGPDDAYKKDNHTNLGGFRHEADEFFAWLNENEIENFFTICGDRHWQYHSIHPSGVEEFACGALNDENSRMGVNPGSKKGTDPEALIEQPYTSPKPGGGFLHLSAGENLEVKFYDDQGTLLYEIKK